MHPRLSRLRYRAWRRGFLEADLVLGPFADEHVERLGDSDLDDFERLLDQTDHDIYAWITEQTPPPAAFDNALLAQIRAFRFRAHAARAGRDA